MLRPQSRNEMELLQERLEAKTGIKPEWTQDDWGNYYGWHCLREPRQITQAAEALSEIHARLATITAYSEARKDPVKRRAMAYHFVLGGTIVTVTIPLYTPDTLRSLGVPSIVKWFRNASWPERECAEMFDVKFEDNPNPERLFLDERLDSGIMTQLIPFSCMVHGVSSKDLWEEVMATKVGYAIPGLEEGHVEKIENEAEAPASGEAKAVPVAPGEKAGAQKIVEPKFTPVSESEGKRMPLETESGEEKTQKGEAGDGKARENQA